MKNLVMTMILGAFSAPAMADQICVNADLEFSALTYTVSSDDSRWFNQPVVGLVKHAEQKLAYSGVAWIQQTRLGSITTFSFTDEVEEDFKIEQRSTFIFLPCGRGSCPEPRETIISTLTYQGQSHELSCTAFDL